MNLNLKNVLIVSYYFPPSGGSGVLRIVRYISNIRQFGWRPFVITTDTRDLDKIAYGTMSRDESFAGIERDLGILRVRSFRPSYALSVLGRSVRDACALLPARFARRRPRADEETRDRPAGERPPGGAAQPAARGRKPLSPRSGGIGRFFFDLTIIVDQLFEWTVPAVSKGIPFARRNKIACIFSSSPPWSVHLISLFLKRLCRRRWIMDLRDPICGIVREGRKKALPTLMESFTRALEMFLIRNADVVVCNCEEIKEYYGQRYPRSRFEVIMNSYDEADFPHSAAGARRKEKITICHIGELYETIRTPNAFLEAAAGLLQEEPALRERLSIEFIGDKRYVHLPAFQNLCTSLDMQTIIRKEGYVPHREAIAKMLEADVLLLLQPHESTRYQIPAKLFEYIATGIPIIAVAPTGSATSNLITRHRLGLVNDPSDTAGMKQSIREAVAGTAPRPSRASIEEFSAVRMTKKLVDILESLK